MKDINKLFGAYVESHKPSKESIKWKSKLRESITENIEDYKLQCRKNQQSNLESNIYDTRF